MVDVEARRCESVPSEKLVVAVTAWLPEEVILLLLQVFLSSSNCTETRLDIIRANTRAPTVD